MTAVQQTSPEAKLLVDRASWTLVDQGVVSIGNFVAFDRCSSGGESTALRASFRARDVTPDGCPDFPGAIPSRHLHGRRWRLWTNTWRATASRACPPNTARSPTFWTERI